MLTKYDSSKFEYYAIFHHPPNRLINVVKNINDADPFISFISRHTFYLIVVNEVIELHISSFIFRKFHVRLHNQFHGNADIVTIWFNQHHTIDVYIESLTVKIKFFVGKSNL